MLIHVVVGMKLCRTGFMLLYAVPSTCRMRLIPDILMDVMTADD